MDQITKQKLIDMGRKDLVDTHEILSSGYAGINKKGMIVDRRVDKEAVPIPYSSMFPNTPPPKEL